ncbi:MAG: putative bifunctional diguanylate cyclase/phosphodiesterase [Burkholderiales bacterium]
MVALFVLCGLLPVAAAMTLSYDYVDDVLIAQRAALLRSAASNYATVLVDRLSVAERLALSAGEGRRAGRLVEASTLARHFRAAVAVEPAGARVLFGAPSRMPTHGEIGVSDRPLGAGAVRLIELRGQNSPPSVWLVLHEPLTERARGQLAFELDADNLFAGDEELPYLTEICVLNSAGLAVECARQPPAAELHRFQRPALGEQRADFTWESDGVRYLSGARELFLGGRFGAASWLVVASQPEEYALAPAQAIGRVVVPVAVLGLLVAALLGGVYVRRTLEPLNELAGAAGRIGKRDFDVRVAATRDDEFGVLARSFNAMSAHLGQQFKALQAQAEIDSVILSSADLSRVATIALRRVSEMGGVDESSLLLADPASPGAYCLYSLDDDGALRIQDIRLSREESGRLRAGRLGLRIGPGDKAQLPALAGGEGTSRLVLRFMLADEVGGAFVLGYHGERGIRADGEAVSLLWKLGDRVAVALATARRDLELHRRAYYDSLTNLPNRLLGIEELSRAVAASARQRRGLAVLFIDLDGFSDVNDSLGHPAGDAVLVQSAARLRGCVRKSDIVARLGGDEFAVVLPELRESADAALVARNAIKTLSAPFDLPEGRAHISASAGVALYPGDGDTAEELLKNADLAMYHAKEQGSGHTMFFEASMNEEVRRRVELERELRQALDEAQFGLYYQPQLELKSGRIVGAEALIRWIHPVRGLVPPAQFIGFAETSGLIDPIGQWALKTACAQLVAWRAEGLPIEYVSVNVSPRQFHSSGFSGAVAEALQAFGVPASALHLELTESAVLGEQAAVRANLAGLNALGTPLELDDFGTGYASLANLRNLPVAVVKLDIAFIRSIHEDASALAVVRAAIDMAHALGKSVVAEGVELAEQAALLTQMGCDMMQGYHLSAAVPADKFAALIRQRAVAVPVALQSRARP